ncbi:MAG: ribosome small subunit-dependent GTPase A [Granulosicoccus sp.]
MNESRPDADCLQARVIANLRSMVAVQIEGCVSFEKAYPLQSLPLLVAGDRVTCQREDSTLRVVELVPRNSVLERADRYSVKPLAANLTDLGIVSANPPGIDTLLIDQFCLAAYRAGVGALVIVNKTDRMSTAERDSAERMVETYRSVGYTAVLIDTKTEGGMKALLQELPGRSITLVGASGAGKSSIIQKLLPDRELRIGAVSEATGLGAHTTSVTYWYDLPMHGSIVDSPGVRQYSVAHLDKSIVRQGFHELAEAGARCRFGDCSHTVEPHCAVLHGIADGSIMQWRYENYLKLIE